MTKINKYTVIETAAMQCGDNAKGIEILSKFDGLSVRLMSFALTVEQMRNQTKTVTRRHTAKHIKVGDLILAVEKARGVRREDRKSIAIIRVVSVTREPLDVISQVECIKEGFPDKTPAQFIELYLKGNSISRSFPLGKIECTRIEFKFEMML